jgi:tetratricopeptide (TPR) repeat protein
VAKSDPGIIRAHTALAYVARLRQNGQLALSESQKAVAAWPNNACLHASLSEAYAQLASNARHGRYWADMSNSVRKTWQDNCEKSIDEAYIAVKLDPNCSDGWFSMLRNGLQLSNRSDMDEAYRQLTRMNPTNVDVYTSYAFCFSPQWGGSDSQQEQVFAQADKAFPRGSHKPLVVRALSLCYNSTGNGRIGSPYANEVLRLSDGVSRKAGDQSKDAIDVKAQAYEINRRRPEFLQVSKLAYEKWGGLTWQYRYGMGCAFAYEDRHDAAYLNKALELFSDYRTQVPYDPRGYIQVGWCLSHLGRRAEAKEQFLKALKLDPANESARKKLQYVQ